MNSINSINNGQTNREEQIKAAIPNRKPSIPPLKRLLSTDSSVGSIRMSFLEFNPASSPRYRYNLCSTAFFIKLLQLMTAIVCASLYSNGMQAMENSIESSQFPNIVFSAFIIITGVITLGYVLGHLMPPILTRIFDIIALTLYFVSACVTIVNWYQFARIRDQPENDSSAWLLLAQGCFSLVNAFLYSYDLYLSITETLNPRTFF